MVNQEYPGNSVHAIKAQRTAELLAAGLSRETLGIGSTGDMYDLATRRQFLPQVLGDLVEIGN